MEIDYFDINDRQLKKFDIIDIHQSVNGQSEFVVYDVENLDIRYYYDTSVQYEYDPNELLAEDKYQGTTTFEIIGNLLD